MVHLPELLEKYGDRAEFLFVYTGERGMTMGTAMHKHQLPEALSEFAEPPNAPPGSRLLLLPRVRAGKKYFGLHLSLLLDNERWDIQSLYGAFPKRLILVDTEGRIAVDSGRGARSSLPWKEVSDWLDHYGESASPRSTDTPG